MEQENRYIAKTLQGLEPVLAWELEGLGATKIREGCRMVEFYGAKELLYKANFFLRTALRILVPLFEFEAKDADELYGQVLAYDWEQVLRVDQKFSVDSVVNSEVFTHSRFAALRVKDAIVDQFRGHVGRRPFVDPDHPDVRVHLHIQGEHCTVLLDSSGDSLHMRGYRRAQDLAPINEVLAAGMILLTGWHGDVPLIDPMCGSGTIAIEAALIARGIAPGIFRSHFGFEVWEDFDADLLDTIYNDDSRERECEVLIAGSDISEKSVEMARINVRAAGLSKTIRVAKQSIFELMPPSSEGVVVTNPPYGERLKQFQLDSFYQQLSDVFKAHWAGWDVWMISGNQLAMKSFGLHPSKTVTLFNGPLECKYQRFSMYRGSLRDRYADRDYDY